MSGIDIDTALTLLGFLLSIIAALIGYMAKSITEIKTFSFKKVASLEVDIKNTNRILAQIIIDLKIVERHATEIAVLQSQLEDVRSGVRQLYKRLHEIETDKKGSS